MSALRHQALRVIQALYSSSQALTVCISNYDLLTLSVLAHFSWFHLKKLYGVWLDTASWPTVLIKLNGVFKDLKCWARSLEEATLPQWFDLQQSHAAMPCRLPLRPTAVDTVWPHQPCTCSPHPIHSTQEDGDMVVLIGLQRKKKKSCIV